VEANAAALNWYMAIKGWELAHDDVRGFNKRALNSDNKLSNLCLAMRHGLRVPRTLLTNEFAAARRALRGPLIEKPAAGGELTGHFDALTAKLAAGTAVGRYPRFVQPRLLRPELRVFRVGDELIGFSLRSPDLDYRAALRSRLKPARVPKALGDKFYAFCSAVGLDFAAADFMRDPRGGEHRFLEVNSQPMFAAFDAVCGGRLCDAIIDALAPRRRG
jgi:glutathione synthase/RimK-type ligase-like ATP-grasp enzyme